MEQILLKAASKHVKDGKVTEQSAWTDQRQVVPSTVRQLTVQVMGDQWMSFTLI